MSEEKASSVFLKCIKIDSFGAFSNKIVGPFNPKLNVVYGKNETGKTTLNAFFSGVMFGWEDARGLRNTYKPKNSERLGTLFFEDTITGDEFEFTRVKNVEGIQGPTRLIDDIDKDTYSTMFALTSDELRSLKNTSDVTAKLLTAGSGTNASPAQALIEIKTRISEYTSRASGVEHSLIQLKQQQEELRTALFEATNEADRFKKEDREFHELEPRRSEMLEKLDSLNEDIEALSVYKSTLERLNAQFRETHNKKEKLLEEETELEFLRTSTTSENALMHLSPTEEYTLRERIDSLIEESSRAEHRVTSARDTYAESKASYEALLEADDVQELEVRAKSQRRVQITLSIILPLLFVVSGVPVFLHGRAINSLSFTALGIGLVVFAVILASAAMVMLFRPNKADEALLQRKKDAQWIMLQDKKKLEACGLELNEHVASVKKYLESKGLEEAHGSLKRARSLLDEAKEEKAESNLLIQRQQALNAQLNSTDEILFEIKRQKANLAKKFNLKEKVTVLTIDDMLAKKTKQRSTLNEASAKTNRRYGELKAELSQAQKKTQFSELKIEYQQVCTRQEESLQDLARLLLAKRMLEAAIAAWESKSQPEVYKQASRLLADMTAGKWVQIKMSPEGTLQVVDAVKTIREPMHLSLGTCQQLYLSLRIALLLTAENVGRIIPIMADDILVNFDEERRRGAARALCELAQKRQVILFTCHTEIVQLMQSADSQTNVLEL